MRLEQQIIDIYDLADPECEHLSTLVNDVVKVTAQSGQFALKIYNPQSRSLKEVRWELAVIEHLMKHGAPVSNPLPGKHGYVEPFLVDGQERVAVLFEWAPGIKPRPEHYTYVLLGKAAAKIHHAADAFSVSWIRDDYHVTVLIDEQLQRMKSLLVEARRWQQMTALGDRLKRKIADSKLDQGICHMDLTLDNVHRDGDSLTVFDFDSSGKCWRAIEPYGVMKFSKDYFSAWLEGYRAFRSFSQDDERAVAAFGIIGDLRVVAWKLGVARSSRGKPVLTVDDIPGVVDDWLHWEANNINRK